MSNSKLVNKTILTDKNFDRGRDGHKIKKITIHHACGIVSIEDLGKFMKNGSRQVSAHYGIGNDGKIGQYVDEKNTAWTDTNWTSNCTSVTIETSNCKLGGKYPVSDKALNSLIKLVADIGKRNKLGKLVKGKNVTWHSMYYSTSCPGKYLLSKMDYIVKKANEINNTTYDKLNLSRVLEKGSTGTAVENLQKALNKDLGTKLKIDGEFGEATYKAVLKYQDKHGIKVWRGKVGKVMAHKLGWLWKGK